MAVQLEFPNNCLLTKTVRSNGTKVHDNYELPIKKLITTVRGKDVGP